MILPSLTTSPISTIREMPSIWQGELIWEIKSCSPQGLIRVNYRWEFLQLLLEGRLDYLAYSVLHYGTF